MSIAICATLARQSLHSLLAVLIDSGHCRGHSAVFARMGFIKPPYNARTVRWDQECIAHSKPFNDFSRFDKNIHSVW